MRMNICLDINSSYAMMLLMRTTIDIDDGIMAQLREMAHRSHTSLKESVNAAIRRGVRSDLSSVKSEPYRCPTFRMGSPLSDSVNLDKALSLAFAIEDSEVARELELRK